MHIHYGYDRRKKNNRVCRKGVKQVVNQLGNHPAAQRRVSQLGRRKVSKISNWTELGRNRRNDDDVKIRATTFKHRPSPCWCDWFSTVAYLNQSDEGVGSRNVSQIPSIPWIESFRLKHAELTLLWQRGFSSAVGDLEGPLGLRQNVPESWEENTNY